MKLLLIAKFFHFECFYAPYAPMENRYGISIGSRGKIVILSEEGYTHGDIILLQ